MKAQNKVQSACDVKIYSDKGSLALRFPLRHNAFWEALDGKSLKGKPKCLGIGKYGFNASEPDDWKRASQIAIAMESDLDHPEWDKLFDPTLAKYGLGGGKYAKLASVTQMPGTVPALPEITVGAMWEAYLEWKKTTIEETTFKKVFGGFSNAIKGLVWNQTTKKFHQSVYSLVDTVLTENKVISQIISDIPICRKAYLINELGQAFVFCKAKGMVVNPTTENPFVLDKFSTPAVTTQQKYANKVVNGTEVQWHEVTDEKALENDRRAFTKEERDIIIKTFYESKSAAKVYAPLIEFYFLTGCRSSEAYSLTWSDIDFNRNIIRFSKSLGAAVRKVKETKTGETRLFYFSNNSRLKELLLEIKGASSNDLIFPSKSGKYLNSSSIGQVWKGVTRCNTLADGTEKTYCYPGVVTQLTEQGAISGYLPQYHTRHTYITLTAHANKHDNNALLYIATACGNSVDVILKHYLGAIENTQIVEA